MFIIYIWVYTIFITLIFGFFIFLKLNFFKYKYYNKNIFVITKIFLWVLILITLLWYYLIYKNSYNLDNAKNMQETIINEIF